MQYEHVKLLDGYKRLLRLETTCPFLAPMNAEITDHAASHGTVITPVQTTCAVLETAWFLQQNTMPFSPSGIRLCNETDPILQSNSCPSHITVCLCHALPVVMHWYWPFLLGRSFKRTDTSDVAQLLNLLLPIAPEVAGRLQSEVDTNPSLDVQDLLQVLYISSEECGRQAAMVSWVPVDVSAKQLTRVEMSATLATAWAEICQASRISPLTNRLADKLGGNSVLRMSPIRWPEVTTVDTVNSREIRALMLSGPRFTLDGTSRSRLWWYSKQFGYVSLLDLQVEALSSESEGISGQTEALARITSALRILSAWELNADEIVLGFLARQIYCRSVFPEPYGSGVDELLTELDESFCVWLRKQLANSLTSTDLYSAALCSCSLSEGDLAIVLDRIVFFGSDFLVHLAARMLLTCKPILMMAQSADELNETLMCLGQLCDIQNLVSRAIDDIKSIDAIQP